uniref:Uncharacterized protein n=1 Tax=Siphoviridae sp. ctDcW16 TaxID=2826199 RepID=A0A8S5MTT3_9CAUD|nr:MAG TPA: hypothetical protein [Siphoviridae sp. ctDcW16]DAL14073.1 MAG TPA_asm: hypothetical protein [Caudoviricetes sp.]
MAVVKKWKSSFNDKRHLKSKDSRLFNVND